MARRKKRASSKRRTTRRRSFNVSMGSMAGLAGHHHRRRRRRSRNLSGPLFRRSRSGKKIQLSAAGLKRAVSVKGMLMALAGMVSVRALYGFIRKSQPTMNPTLVAALSVLGAVAGGIVISGRAATVVPLAVGASASAIFDVLAPKIANSLAQNYPEVAAAIMFGTGNDQSMYAPAPTGGPVGISAGASGTINNRVSPTGPTFTFADLPDAYGLGENGVPDELYAAGYEDAMNNLPDAWGLGDIDMVTV